MIKLATIFADGCEEIETVTPVDVLRRVGIDCQIISINDKFVKGSHGIVIKADKLIEEVCLDHFDGIIIPGGMPGAVNIANDKRVIQVLRTALKNNKLVASICASPAVVLANNKLISKKKLTCYPAENFINMLKDNYYTANDVEVDGNLITANGPKSALAFAKTICQYFSIEVNF